jgi:thymidylate synthase ThyX
MLPERKWLEDSEGFDYSAYDGTFFMSVKGSIASFHQEVRNRQERILWPSWEEVVKDDKYVLPLPLKPRSQLVSEVYKTAQDLGENFWKEGKTESAVFSQPLGKEIHVISTIHGRDNIIYTFMLRTCQMAQQEIRNRFREAAKEIEKKFGSRLGPRCEIEGKCYEARRKECPQYQPAFEVEVRKE